MKPPIKTILTCILMAILLPGKAALPYQEAFDKGNELYAQENYAQAIEQYQSALQDGYECWEVFFNIGNAYYRSGNYPQSILFYERAAQRAPKQKEIRGNLALAESKIADRFDQMPVFFASAWWNSLVSLFTEKGWGITLTVLFFLGLSCLGLYFTGQGYAQRKAAFYGLLLSTALLATSLFAAIDSYRVAHREYAIVTEISVEAKTSPEERSQTAFTLHEGSKVQIEDRIGNYGKVRVKNGSRAWVPMDCLTRI